MAQDFEFYRTPACLTQWLVDQVGPALTGTSICEPCVGDGAILQVFADRHLARARVLTNDLDPQWPADTHEDASTAAYWAGFLPGMVDWVVTNPPFSAAGPVLAAAWPVVQRGVILHVRATFHEALKTGLRRSLLRECPPQHVLWLPRIRFRVNPDPTKTATTDSTATCWVIWSKTGPLPGVPAHAYPPEWLLDQAAAYRP